MEILLLEIVILHCSLQRSSNCVVCNDRRRPERHLNEHYFQLGVRNLRLTSWFGCVVRDGLWLRRSRLGFGGVCCMCSWYRRRRWPPGTQPNYLNEKKMFRSLRSFWCCVCGREVIFIHVRNVECFDKASSGDPYHPSVDTCHSTRPHTHFQVDGVEIPTVIVKPRTAPMSYPIFFFFFILSSMMMNKFAFKLTKCDWLMVSIPRAPYFNPTPPLFDVRAWHEFCSLHTQATHICTRCSHAAGMSNQLPADVCLVHYRHWRQQSTLIIGVGMERRGDGRFSFLACSIIFALICKFRKAHVNVIFE